MTFDIAYHYRTPLPLPKTGLPAVRRITCVHRYVLVSTRVRRAVRGSGRTAENALGPDPVGHHHHPRHGSGDGQRPDRRDRTFPAADLAAPAHPAGGPTGARHERR